MDRTMVCSDLGAGVSGWRSESGEGEAAGWIMAERLDRTVLPI